MVHLAAFDLRGVCPKEPCAQVVDHKSVHVPGYALGFFRMSIDMVSGDCIAELNLRSVRVMPAIWGARRLCEYAPSAMRIEGLVKPLMPR